MAHQPPSRSPVAPVWPVIPLKNIPKALEKVFGVSASPLPHHLQQLLGELLQAKSLRCCLQAGARTGAVTGAQRVLVLLAAAAAASGHPSQPHARMPGAAPGSGTAMQRQWKAARGSTWRSNEHTLLLLHHPSSTLLLLPSRNIEYPKLDTQRSPSPAASPAQDTLTILPHA